VGVTEVSEKIWLVSFTDFDLGYFDEVEGRVEPGPNPFSAKVLTMSSARPERLELPASWFADGEMS
jgi:hypothetical protein